MKHSIKGTAKLVLNSVYEGNLSLRYDKDIVKWMKDHLEYDVPLFEIIYMNYESLSKQISKLVGVKFVNNVNYVEYPYTDKHYINCMDFHIDTNISNEKIKKALKGKVFTIKLKAERF